jgi:hypothetical protein
MMTKERSDLRLISHSEPGHQDEHKKHAFVMEKKKIFSECPESRTWIVYLISEDLGDIVATSIQIPLE